MAGCCGWGGAGAGAENAGAGGAGIGAGGGAEGVVLKNCVKLPSADAESEMPGVENPFIFGGAVTGGGTGTDSITVRAGCSFGVAAPLTKIRVNSPGPGPELGPELGAGAGGCDGIGAGEE